MKANTFCSQSVEERRVGRTRHVRLPLLPIARTENPQQVALGAPNPADAMDVQDPFRH